MNRYVNTPALNTREIEAELAVGAFLVTAIITPGDVVTAQIVMGLPMTLLYFLSVGLSWLVARRRARSEAAIEEVHGA